MASNASSNSQWILRSLGLVILIYLGSIFIASIGTYLAYNGVLSSEAWRSWDTLPWKKDIARCAVVAIGGFYIIFNLKLNKNISSLFPLNQRERTLTIFFLLILLLLNFWILPNNFRKTKCYSFQNISLVFKEIWLPYFPYLLYNFGLWLGIVTPAFLYLLRSIIFDLKEQKQSRSKLAEIEIPLNSSCPEYIEDVLMTLKFNFQNYTFWLNNLVERYLPVVLVIALLLIHEQLTPVGESILEYSLEIVKTFLWVMLYPLVFLLLGLVAFGYQEALKTVDNICKNYQQKLLNWRKTLEIDTEIPKKFKETIEEISQMRESIILKTNPIRFAIYAATKNPSVSMPLLFSFTIYIIKHFGSQGTWLNLFVPQNILDFIKSFYGI